MESLLADVASDVEVVTRERGLKDEMRERLRRALNRVECARGVLGAVRENAGSEGAWKELPTERGARGSANGEPHGDYENDDSIGEKASLECDGIARKEWPQDYPEGAVEWHILERMQ